MEILLGELRTGTPGVMHNDAIVTGHGAVRKGMKVVGRDGTAGRVVMVVSSPEMPGTTQLVVRQGWWNRRLFLIPLGWIVDIAGNEIRLNVYRRQLDLLPEYRTDVEIAADVQAVLANSPVFDRADVAAIRVEVDRSMVMLHGNVRNAARKYAARQLVEGVRGVRGVQIRLIDDDEIMFEVERALKYREGLEGTAVRIDVTLGLVILRGTVRTTAQREQIKTLVQYIHGVRRIADELTNDGAPTVQNGERP